jgi:hypothetical protein
LGFGFGLGFALGGSSSTSIASPSLSFFFFLVFGFVFGEAFAGLSPSSASPSLALAFFFFGFFGGSPSFALPLLFAFDLAAFVSSRSPLASEAVALPSTDESLSLGEPASEADAWKSSSVRVQKSVRTAVKT